MTRGCAFRVTEKLRSKTSIYHLERGAYVYVRQSTQNQARADHAGQEDQYACSNAPSG